MPSKYKINLTLMKRKLLFNISLLLGCCLAVAQNPAGTFRLLTSKPIAGQVVKFTYNSKGSKLVSTQPVHASVYKYANYKWSIEDVALNVQNGEYVGEIRLSAKCALAALKFYQGNTEAPEAVDNNDNAGFTIIPVNSKNTKNPGAVIGVALLQMPVLGSGSLNYQNDFNNKLEPSVLTKLLAEESQIPGSDTKNYIEAYVAMQKTIKGEQFSVFIVDWLNNLLKRTDLSEDDLWNIQKIFQFTLKDKSKADSVSKVILQKYPKGAFARLEAFRNTMQHDKTTEDMIFETEGFLKNFPYSVWLNSPNEQEFIYYETHRVLSSMYFDTRKFDSFLKMIPELNFKTLNEIYRWNIEKVYIQKRMSKDSLSILAQPLMTEMLKKINDGSMASNGFFSKEHAIENAHSELDKRLVIHIGLLADLNKNEEALSYFQYLTEKIKLTIPELNDTHLQILENKHADKAKVKSFMELCVAQNAVSPSMFNKLKTLYLEQHADLNKFNDYLSSLKSFSTKEELKRKVTKSLINIECIPFELEDLDGNIVRSSDWKDKIVVLDFWATWCRPCISALPAMQILVDKYATDPKIDFYFVGTMQFGDYKPRTEEFIKKEKFRLKFVYDKINDKTGAQDAAFSIFAHSFNSSGIPRKVIVKDGYIRYTTEGYSGSASELVDELSCAIELLKAE